MYNNIFNNYTSNSNNNSNNNNTGEFDLVLYAALIAYLLGENLTGNEQNLLGNFLLSVGQNLALMSSINTESIETNSVKTNKHEEKYGSSIINNNKNINSMKNSSNNNLQTLTNLFFK